MCVVGNLEYVMGAYWDLKYGLSVIACENYVLANRVLFFLILRCFFGLSVSVIARMEFCNLTIVWFIHWLPWSCLMAFVEFSKSHFSVISSMNLVMNHVSMTSNFICFDGLRVELRIWWLELSILYCRSHGGPASGLPEWDNSTRLA